MKNVNGMVFVSWIRFYATPALCLVVRCPFWVVHLVVVQCRPDHVTHHWGGGESGHLAGLDLSFLLRCAPEVALSSASLVHLKTPAFDFAQILSLFLPGQLVHIRRVGSCVSSKQCRWANGGCRDLSNQYRCVGGTRRIEADAPFG